MKEPFIKKDNLLFIEPWMNQDSNLIAGFTTLQDGTSVGADVYKRQYYECKVNFTSKTERSCDVKNRLEELRKARGINQEELATILEVSRQTISSLEKGRYNPSIVLAFKIARYFGLTIEEIFIYEEESEC